MSTQPSVIVNKRSGFFTALVQGFFLMIVTALICVTLLGCIGMLVFNQKSSDILAFGSNIINKLEDWEDIVPPVVADMFQTQRAVHYRDQLSVEVKHFDGGDHSMVMLEVKNNGDDVVSWLTGHMVAFDDDGMPLGEHSIAIATPFMFHPDERCREWEQVRGPLLPGSVRQIPIDEELPRNARVTLELTDIRVWHERPVEIPVREAVTAEGQGTVVVSPHPDYVDPQMGDVVVPQSRYVNPPSGNAAPPPQTNYVDPQAGVVVVE